ncbi:MAG: serine/threonine-protein kinase, partial [Pyrinomonadaceae bacterium]
MGEVYLAEDTSLKRLVAIKLLPDDVIEAPLRLRRFEREAYAASSLNHPNILTIYEIGEAEGCRFIASEYVEGENLRQRMARRRMSLKEIVDTTLQVASALAAAEHEGIVHRDIKPENIMLRKDGYVKVLDFGLAKLINKASVDHWGEANREARTITMTNTSPGIVMGTVAYMSPEQARGRDVDGRSDIWSLGVVLYEMLTGNMPFKGETSSDVVAAILKTDPEPLPHFSLG